MTKTITTTTATTLLSSKFRKFESAASMQVWLDNPLHHKLYEVKGVDWTTKSIEMLPRPVDFKAKLFMEPGEERPAEHQLVKTGNSPTGYEWVK